MDLSDNSRVVGGESLDELRKLHDEELTKIRKLRLVIRQLDNIDTSKMDIPDTELIERALNISRVADYIRFNEENELCLLNLSEQLTIHLSYTERKAVRQQLALTLQNNLQPIKEFAEQLRTELPEVFSNTGAPSEQIVALERQRRANLERLLELRARKCAYLKAAAELKMGPYLGHELDLMYAQTRENQIKANVLRGYFINELLTRSEHSVGAIKEVEEYINRALEQGRSTVE